MKKILFIIIGIVGLFFIIRVVIQFYYWNKANRQAIAEKFEFLDRSLELAIPDNDSLYHKLIKADSLKFVDFRKSVDTVSMLIANAKHQTDSLSDIYGVESESAFPFFFLHGQLIIIKNKIDILNSNLSKADSSYSNRLLPDSVFHWDTHQDDWQNQIFGNMPNMAFKTVLTHMISEIKETERDVLLKRIKE